MWAKVLTNVIISLVTTLVQKSYGLIKNYLSRKQRVQRTEDVAKKVEAAKTPADIRAAADDLP